MGCVLLRGGASYEDSRWNAYAFNVLKVLGMIAGFQALWEGIYGYGGRAVASKSLHGRLFAMISLIYI